MKLFIFS